MKKRILLLTTCLCVAMVFSACGKKDDSASASASVSASGSAAVSASAGSSAASASMTAEEIAAAQVASENKAANEVLSSSLAAAASTAAASGTGASATPTAASTGASSAAATSGVAPAASSAAAPASVNLSGSFTAYDPARYPDERAPYLMLSDKGGFVLHFNLGDGRLAVMTGTYTLSGNSLSLDVLYCDSEDFLGAGTTSLAFTMDGPNLLTYNGAPLGMTRAGDEFARQGASMGTGGAGDTGGKNMYILVPGQVLEGNITITGQAATSAAATAGTAAPASAASMATGASNTAGAA